MLLKIPKKLVEADWLFSNLENKDLIILDATISKVTSSVNPSVENKQIKNARFFDIKNTFSNANAKFPNTILSPEEFQTKAQELGINSNSCIVVYDDLGMYSSPRVWWMFTLMGFKNIAVLNGGFPAWKEKYFPIENKTQHNFSKGNFKVNHQPEKLVFTDEVLSATTNNNFLIVDARSSGRFFGTEPEPRDDVKSGHIPNSINLPYDELFEKGNLKPSAKLKQIFEEINPANKQLIFSCGSGITASILAFTANLVGCRNTAVYDGSWTEWGSSTNLPIEI